MPRLIQTTDSSSSSSSTFLARRETPAMRRPTSPFRSRAAGASSTSACTTSTFWIRLPTAAGRIPRTIVSASGSSGTA
jgi:hypothetical protein